MTRLDRLRDETAATFRLAVPVAGVQLGIMLMGVIDTMMLGHLSADALAAGALAHIVTFCVLVLGQGILTALDPLVSQAHGARDSRAVANYLQRGLVMAAVLTVPFCLSVWDMAWLFRLAGQPEAVIPAAAAYARAIAWGSLPFFLFLVVRQTLQAMSVVRPAMMAIIVGNLVNILGNYMLIFGHFGAPALGVEGSAYSTSIARWVMFFYLLGASRHTLAAYWRGFTREAVALRGHLLMLRLGLPIGLHNSVELLIFALVALMIGHIGVRELGGNQIALNLASLSFMVPLGISGAAATRVGNAIGREDMPGARLAAAASLLLGAGVMIVFAVLFASFPQFLARLYTRDAAVIAVAAALLPIAAVFQVFDGTQVVGAGILRGSADTTFPAGIALVGFWLVGLPAGWALAFPGGLGPRGLWWGLTIGLSAVSSLFVARIAFRFRGTIRRVGHHPPYT